MLQVHHKKSEIRTHLHWQQFYNFTKIESEDIATIVSAPSGAITAGHSKNPLPYFKKKKKNIDELCFPKNFSCNKRYNSIINIKYNSIPKKFIVRKNNRIAIKRDHQCCKTPRILFAAQKKNLYCHKNFVWLENELTK